MMAKMELGFFVALLLPSVLGGEGSSVSFLGHELLSSQLWGSATANLFLVKESSSLPADVMEFMTTQFNQLDVVVVEVLCQAGDTGEVCSLLATHEAVIARRKGGMERDMVRIESFSKFKDITEYLTHILEEMLGEAITHVTSHSLLASSLSGRPQCFLVLALDSSSTEYLSFLKSYLTQHTVFPVIVTHSKETLPLTQRPPHRVKEPPVHLWRVHGSGKHWYKLYQLQLMEAFIQRAQYPIIVDLSEEENFVKDYQNRNLHIVLFFTGLPGFSRPDLRLLVQQVARKLHLKFIYVMADRERESAAARRYSVTSNYKHPQVVVLIKGVESNLVSFEVGAGDLEEEAHHIAELLLQSIEREEEKVETADGGVSPISIADLMGVDMFVNRSHTNLVVAFCKKGDGRCPNDLYSSMESAYKTFAKAHLNVSYIFFVVECTSVKDILKYKLNVLPTYAVYNKTEKVWLAGLGNVYYPRDILTTLAQETDHRELLDIPQHSPQHTHELHHNDAALDSDYDTDIYARLGHTLPRPSLPQDLVLTDENFEKRIMNFEKTAVLFYVYWSEETKLVLHHLVAAWDQLDPNENMTMGAVDCHSYTRTCARFNVTTFPGLLVFTPSTITSPTSPQDIGVLDSMRLLQSLHPTQQQGVRELTPASLPILLGLREGLATPLVLWCGEDLSSELAHVFSDVALSSSNTESLTFAWISSSHHFSILSSAFSLHKADLPTVLALRLDKRAVFQMEAIQNLQLNTFKERLMAFLQQLGEGTLTPGSLSSGTWLPKHPPLHFPSEQLTHEESWQAADHDQGIREGEFQNYYTEGLDLESIPKDMPPQVPGFPEEWDGELHHEEL